MSQAVHNERTAAVCTAIKQSILASEKGRAEGVVICSSMCCMQKLMQVNYWHHRPRALTYKNVLNHTPKHSKCDKQTTTRGGHAGTGRFRQPASHRARPDTSSHGHSHSHSQRGDPGIRASDRETNVAAHKGPSQQLKKLAAKSLWASANLWFGVREALIRSDISGASSGIPVLEPILCSLHMYLCPTHAIVNNFLKQS